MRLDAHQRDELALGLAVIAGEAGQLLRRMQSGSCPHRLKEDGSPTSAADLAAEDLIIARLGERWPDVPVIAEETASTAAPSEAFFVVDPLDGTRDFLHGTGEFCVNVALVLGDRPAAAAIAAPALGRVWMAGATASEVTVEDGRLSTDRRVVRVRAIPATGPVALVSRRHGDDQTDACVAALAVGGLRTASSAIKFCLLASGEADLYVRFGPTMEWDTAAGDHIVSCAGGRVVGPGRTPLTYGHGERGYLNGPFAAVGDPSLADRVNLLAC
jgi:3'(2'), 5'-bisphosphate nucleotidase